MMSLRVTMPDTSGCGGDTNMCRRPMVRNRLPGGWGLGGGGRGVGQGGAFAAWWRPGRAALLGTSFDC